VPELAEGRELREAEKSEGIAMRRLAFKPGHERAGKPFPDTRLWVR
jgi:hypothetical protein